MDFKQVNFGYSLKNIPIPSNQEYLKAMLSKLEHFIKRLRWKAFFFDLKADTIIDKEIENYGFKSECTPPQHEALNAFEEDLYSMVKSVKFRPTRNAFQSQLARDIDKIKKSRNIFVPADKTTNMYELAVYNYKKLLTDNVTSTYQKAETSTLGQINTEAKAIAQDLKLDERIECFPPNQAFITLKDHKENFLSHPKCRLINPAKPAIGKVSKHHLDSVNTKLRRKTGLNQWRNTADTLSWFTSISDKENCKFLKFDITNFYPSISEKLFADAINHARQFVNIDDDTVKIIMHCRRSLLFCDGDAWSKKDDSRFDVTMGAYDGAEVCELVGLFLLHHLSLLLGKEAVGLYRDDGLAIIRNASGPEADKTRKQVEKIFQQHNLKVIADTNLVQTDFLDVVLNFNTGKFSPFRKPNDNPLYINIRSNHPPTITKHLPLMIEKRISKSLTMKANSIELHLHMNKPCKRVATMSSFHFNNNQHSAEKGNATENATLYGLTHHIMNK